MTGKLQSEFSFALTGTVTPRGDGSFVVTPGKPVIEVGTEEALRILNIKGRSTLYDLRNHPKVGPLLKWRFTTPSCKLIVWDLESLHAVRAASKDWGQ
jgi:hypothetical protein